MGWAEALGSLSGLSCAIQLLTFQEKEESSGTVKGQIGVSPGPFSPWWNSLSVTLSPATLLCPNMQGVCGVQKVTKRWAKMGGLANSSHCVQSQLSNHLILEAFHESLGLPQTMGVPRTCHCNGRLTPLISTQH